MRSRLRIAAIGLRGLPSSYSGLERSSEGLYAALAARGHEITVYCRPEYLAPSRRGVYRGIQLIATPAIRRKSLDTLSHVATSLGHAITVGRYDLIHLHAIAPGLFSSLGRRLRIPTVATVQGLDWQRAKWKGFASTVLQRAERSMVQNVDEIIVVSRDLQRYFASEYGRETRFVPNGVEPVSAVEVPDWRALQSLGLERGEFILFVGRLVPEKRVEDLLRAFRDLSTSRRLAIVGESSWTDDYVGRLRALAGDDPRIVFTGFQSGDALEALFRGASAYVTPSELEGLPMSLLECMQYGTPAVVSDIPPHRELLEGVAGYDLFFPVGDPAALRSQLTRVLWDSARYQAVAHRAQRHVRLAHAWPAIAVRTEEIFRDAIFGTSRGRVDGSDRRRSVLDGSRDDEIETAEGAR